MTVQDFLTQVKEGGAPPTELSREARALWLGGVGDWHGSHELCQDAQRGLGARIHAWLHRQEGDYGNALYWYHRAEAEAWPQEGDLEKEWQELVEAALAS